FVTRHNAGDRLLAASYYGLAGIAECALAVAPSCIDAAHNGATPLLFAAQEGHTDIVRALL
ncbi:MAG TPA: hypothetical protein DEA50_04795, partial [Parvularcula sp.]|nr:hypothetical protein [Parvularcula sp.]